MVVVPAPCPGLVTRIVRGSCGLSEPLRDAPAPSLAGARRPTRNSRNTAANLERGTAATIGPPLVIRRGTMGSSARTGRPKLASAAARERTRGSTCSATRAVPTPMIMPSMMAITAATIRFWGPFDPRGSAADTVDDARWAISAPATPGPAAMICWYRLLSNAYWRCFESRSSRCAVTPAFACNTARSSTATRCASGVNCVLSSLSCAW